MLHNLGALSCACKYEQIIVLNTLRYILPLHAVTGQCYLS